MRRVIICMLATFGAMQVAWAQEGAPGLPERPILVVDPGRHNAPIVRADVDANGTVAVTGSHDRTVRIWSVADGSLRRTIRIPRGPGNIGKAWAVAIDPAGEVIAAGGWTRWTPEDPQQQIYLFDAATGEMTGRIAGLPNVVNHLAFSPDGRRLAVALGGALGGGAGIRLYDRDAGWAEIARDEPYGGPSYGVAFARDGRLASTSYDGRLRLYDRDGGFVTEVDTGHPYPFGVAFEPDGDRIAVGFFERAEVRLFDSRTLALLPGPDVAGIEYGDLFAVAWSADGETLYAGGGYQVYVDGAWRTPVAAWSDDGRAERRTLVAGTDTVMSIIPLSDGDLLVATQDPWLGLLGPDGTPRWPPIVPAQMDPSGQKSTLSVSEDGTVVDFGYAQSGARPARFDVTTLTVTAEPPDDGRTRPPEQQGLDIVWDYTASPMLDGQPLPVEPLETSFSLAIHPDGKRFVLGTHWNLRAFDAAGAEIWRREAQSGVWAVNISGDGRLVVAADDDGTMRWHRMEDGQEILALFPLVDGENWVAWTPEGVYAATPGARGVLRWHTNRGWDQAATETPVWAIPETHRPDVIRHVLAQLGTTGALAVTELAKIRGAVQRATGASVAPGARLHVLAAGVSAYGPRAGHLKLDYADADARDLLGALVTSQSGLYARVVPQLLENGTATKGGLLRALDTMRQMMAQGEGRDVAVVHFSGHGAVVDGTFYLLPHDVDAGDAVAIRTTALSAAELRGEVARLAQHGRVILLLDACRSGTATGGGAALPADARLLRDELRGPNVTVLTSSSADEDSVEHQQWLNGAFTEAVLEALTTLADQDRNGIIGMGEMAEYVARRTRQITVGRQSPDVDMRFQTDVFVAGL